MKKKDSILIKKLATKSIVWFQNSNSYLVFEHVTAQIIEKLNKQLPIDKITTWCTNALNIPQETALKFVSDVKQLIASQTSHDLKISPATDSDFLKTESVPTRFYASKKYCINQLIFLIDYESDYLESLIHLKFDHLLVETAQKQDIHYQFFLHQESIVFYKNGKIIGNWQKDNAHFFQGKVSMHIVMDIYNKPEKDWLGVFHASALSNGKESLLFLGDSGSGKSTSLALLSAHNFECLADDFVPVNTQQKVHAFPAAISVKKSSITLLLRYYSELKSAAEIYLPNMQKTVRFLAPKKINYQQEISCKALVFIKYKKDTDLQVNSLSKIEAFQKLVPDSWISPTPENAAIFLNWFSQLPCYELTYSNNQKMIETVTKIFNDEL